MPDYSSWMHFGTCFPARLVAFAVQAGLILAACPAGAGAPQVKHIILFIGDGMQAESEVAASRYLFGKSSRLSFHKFGFQTPVSTWDVTTYNRSAARMGTPAYQKDAFDPKVGYAPELGGRRPFPYDSTGRDSYFLRTMGATDSASAATAWATGYKTDGGNLSWLPGDPLDGALPTIAELLRSSNGASIGVVSTVPFTHATPAAQVARNPARDHYYTGYAGYSGLGLAEEIVFQTRPEVVIGGGHPALNNPSFSTSGGYISRNVYESLKEGRTDYLFVERQPGVDGGGSLLAAAEEAVARKRPLFGLFGAADGSFGAAMPVNSPGAPRLQRGDTADPLLKDATLAALRVLSQDPDGFFVLLEQGAIDWANHGNNYNWMIGNVWDLHQAVEAAIDFVNRPGDGVTWKNTLLIVTADHATGYLRMAREKNRPVLGLGELPTGIGRIGFDEQSNAVYEPADAQAFFGSGGHTDELVMLYAKGAGLKALAKRKGSWYRGTRILDNTQLFEAMAEAGGVGLPSREARQ
jgi:alkaline phosphatase